MSEDDTTEVAAEDDAAAAAGPLGETVQEDGSILIADAEGNEVDTIPAVGTQEVEDVADDDDEVD